MVLRSKFVNEEIAVPDRLDGFREPTNHDTVEKRAAEESLNIYEKYNEVSVQIEAQLGKNGAASPVLFILSTAHQNAVEAMVQFIDAEFTDLDQVRRLQETIKRYRDIGEWLAYAVRMGREAYNRVPDDVQNSWLDHIAGGENG